MKFDYPTRVKTAISILVLLTVGSSFNHLYRDVILLPVGEDTVTVFEERFHELRKLLPKAGAIGYVSHADPVGSKELCIVQYVLAPLIVSTSAATDLVVAKFPDADSVRKPSEQHQLVRDFGNGVALFAKRVEP